MIKTKHITRNIWLLSLVSLFTDFASEMLYPVMPVYLKSIGFSVAFIGVLEGIAEAVAGLSKGYFGQKSDASLKRLPFVQLGYGLSAISKPMMAAFIQPIWILFSRITDRVGKGIRTGARDAMLNDECRDDNKGAVFGFHRSMDTFGAVIGPASALLFLYFFPGKYRLLFLLAFLPGLAAVAATMLVKEKPRKTFTPKESIGFLSFVNYWKNAGKTYKTWTAALLVFALINSSDVFLLLQMKEHGLSDTGLIGIYIFYNLVYTLLAWPFGMLADKIKLKNMLLVGLMFFSLTYLLMFGGGLSNTWWVFATAFFLYGCYAAATEGVSKALIAGLVPKEQTASAIGTFTAFQSIASMIAGFIAGLIWVYAGPGVVFLMAAAVSICVFFYLLRR